MADKGKTLSKTVTEDDSTADAKRDKYSAAGFSTTKDGNNPICPHCNLVPRADADENLSELHATLSPKCKYVMDVIRKTPTVETDDSATARAQIPVPYANPRDTRQNENETGQAEAREPSSLDQWSILLDQFSTLVRSHFCRTCRIRPICMMYFPCRDFYSCEYCSQGEEECMECNRPILTKEKVFRS